MDLANQGEGTDVLLLQSMGPILDFDALPHNSQYLLNVRPPASSVSVLDPVGEHGLLQLHRTCSVKHCAVCSPCVCMLIRPPAPSGRVSDLLLLPFFFCPVQTSHITPTQAGAVLKDISPRLAAVHHLTVNDASRVAIVSDIRTGYPEGSPAADLPCLEHLRLHQCQIWTVALFC